MVIALGVGLIFPAELLVRQGAPAEHLTLNFLLSGILFTPPTLFALLVVAATENTLANRGFRSLATFVGPIAAILIMLWMGKPHDYKSLIIAFKVWGIYTIPTCVAWMVTGWIWPTWVYAPRLRLI